MSDAEQPPVAEVRAAAEAVKAALDRHLAAVENRSGEDDPAVYQAFNELAAAAETYDEVLYERFDEVTPFEIPGAEDSLPPYTGPQEPSALSVLIRRDYTVDRPELLLAQAQRVADLDPQAPGSGVHAALGVLFGEYEPDEVASRHTEFGLEEGDSTLWVAAVEEPAEPGEWLDAPFEGADPQQVICRFDVSAVFDDDPEDDFEPAHRPGLRTRGHEDGDEDDPLDGFDGLDGAGDGDDTREVLDADR